MGTANKVINSSVLQGTAPFAASVHRLHLGCSTHVIAGWINVDGSWNAWLEKFPMIRQVLASLRLISKRQATIDWGPGVEVHDFRRPLPYADASMSAVYASHTLEHLYRHDAEKLLRECYRVLVPGGVVRMVVPDLRSIVQEYLGELTLPPDPDVEGLEITPADLMNFRLRFQPPTPKGSSVIYRMYRSLTEFDSHKWMYDARSLSLMLRRAGFAEVSQKDLNDSRIPDIAGIEIPERVLHGAGICVEGVRPVTG